MSDLRDALIILGFIGFLIVFFIWAWNPETCNAKIDKMPIMQSIHSHYHADSVKADSIKNALDYSFAKEVKR